MKLPLKLSAALLAASLLAGCESPSMLSCEPAKDWGPESLGLAMPKPLPFDSARLDVNAIAPFYARGIPVIAALVGGRYAEVQLYFDEVAKRAVFEDRYYGIWEPRGLLYKRGLSLLPMLQAWLAQTPDSKAAQLMLGLAYADAASVAHGGRYASKTTDTQRAAHAQRLAFAVPLLEAVAADDDALGLAAREALIHGQFMTGHPGQGWAGHDEVLSRLPLQADGYIDALEYAHPKWSGARSEERGAHVMALAEKQGLNPQAQQLLAQIVSAHRTGMDKNEDPRAWRPYWTARTAEVPGQFNLRHWLREEMAVENWNAVAALAQRIIDLSPADSSALFQNAWALQQLGKSDEAFSAMVSAAAAGSDSAMGQIVYAYVKGTLGRKQQDFSTMYEYCKFGAALGLPSAANCMASSHTDGFGGAKRDDALAVGWHLMAARGGEINSMHDLGVLLPRVVASDDGRSAAAYWMRKAADAKHVYAVRKVGEVGEVGEAGEPDLSVGCRLARKPEEFMALLVRVYVFFVRSNLGGHGRSSLPRSSLPDCALTHD
jgi:Domain of unknown function (DUF4034)